MACKLSPSIRLRGIQDVPTVKVKTTAIEGVFLIDEEQFTDDIPKADRDHTTANTPNANRNSLETSWSVERPKLPADLLISSVTRLTGNEWDWKQSAFTPYNLYQYANNNDKSKFLPESWHCKLSGTENSNTGFFFQETGRDGRYLVPSYTETLTVGGGSDMYQNHQYYYEQPRYLDCAPYANCYSNQQVWLGDRGTCPYRLQEYSSITSGTQSSGTCYNIDQYCGQSSMPTTCENTEHCGQAPTIPWNSVQPNVCLRTSVGATDSAVASDSLHGNAFLDLFHTSKPTLNSLNDAPVYCPVLSEKRGKKRSRNEAFMTEAEQPTKRMHLSHETKDSYSDCCINQFVDLGNHIQQYLHTSNPPIEASNCGRNEYFSFPSKLTKQVLQRSTYTAPANPPGNSDHSCSIDQYHHSLKDLGQAASPIHPPEFKDENSCPEQKLSIPHLHEDSIPSAVGSRVNWTQLKHCHAASPVSLIDCDTDEAFDLNSCPSTAPAINSDCSKQIDPLKTLMEWSSTPSYSSPVECVHLQQCPPSTTPTTAYVDSANRMSESSMQKQDMSFSGSVSEQIDELWTFHNLLKAVEETARHETNSDVNKSCSSESPQGLSSETRPTQYHDTMPASDEPDHAVNTEETTLVVSLPVKLLNAKEGHNEKLEETKLVVSLPINLLNAQAVHSVHKVQAEESQLVVSLPLKFLTTNEALNTSQLPCSPDLMPVSSFPSHDAEEVESRVGLSWETWEREIANKSEISPITGTSVDPYTSFTWPVSGLSVEPSNGFQRYRKISLSAQILEFDLKKTVTCKRGLEHGCSDQSSTGIGQVWPKKYFLSRYMDENSLSSSSLA